MKTIIHVESREKEYWKEQKIHLSEIYEDTLNLTAEKGQEVLGFGGCFNELGWDALKKVEAEVRENFIKELYSKEGCNFNMGRVPIGANDFSLEWYSCDETYEDYELKDFNIERDKKYTIPFIKEAQKYCPELTLFASPWSPPTWMKTKKAYNFGRIIMDEKVLDAYARYFVKFIQAYKEQDIQVSMVHVQNEPMADQKFPSCLWYGEDMRDFIKGYLGPELKKSGLDTELWLGTINGPFTDYRWPGLGDPYHQFYDQWANTVLSDKEAKKYITGVGVQWGGKHQLEQIEASFPEMRIMQTESECGDGLNEWEQAEYIFTLMWYYFRHGAERYAYWNMVLLEGGISTWGWTQNSLATINEKTGELTLQPEFYLMKHFSHFVKPGAKIVKTTGCWTSNATAFENPNGQMVVVLLNSQNRDREFTCNYKNDVFSTIVKAHTINTFVIE
ncbi:glycoside hydrolase family 30 protein [Clostridium brassicae]|uniref:Glycoside hydrolase family 30 protein n=1 Tax=Clostridium brassicae TaxID=2999072 RepID=A0ABT4D8W3_9CLOT|nr:glycoside hydrolase family 30 protein [Clostridium brassicae]MCY6957646.1 glycoside hydrolase family 30 protein [Clostridium brassicae]